MKHNYFSRKTRQLNLLVKKLKLALESGDKSTAYVESLKLRISLLLKQLTGYFSKRQLKGILGSLAIIFGLTVSNNVNAQTFGAPVQNPFGIAILSPSTVAPTAEADIDNDGDYDLIQTGYGGIMQYFQNNGTPTAPAFASPIGVMNSYVQYAAPAAADMDNDGDIDILIGGLYSGGYGVIQYFENTGTAAAPSFGSPVMNPFGLTSTFYLSFLTVADLDGDGDIDILTSEYYGNLQYFENTGTASAPAFAAPVSNPFGIVPPAADWTFPNLGDLDGDGDYDLLVGETYGSINYYENTGTPTSPAFAASVANPFGLTSVYYYSAPNLVNLDGDCDMDLLVSEYTGTLNYFENTAPAPDATVTAVGTTITANQASASYQWVDCNNGNAAIPGATSQSFTPTATGSYAVEVTTSGCTVLSVCTDVCIVDATVTTVGVTMTANASGATYQWVDCNNGNAAINGETSQSFTATANGSYAVEVTLNGCTEMSSCITISTIGLDENALLNTVSIYPNPSNGIVNIDLGALNSANVVVTGLNGQVVYQKENIITGSHQFELIEATGIYFVEVSSMGAKQVFKLVKK